MGWSESVSLVSRIFTTSPTSKFQLISRFSAPVSRSTIFQRIFVGVVLRLISAISSSHSMPSRVGTVTVAEMRVALHFVTHFVMYCRRANKELHPTFGTTSRLLTDDLRVHRTCIDRHGTIIGNTHVHLCNERERLIRSEYQGMVQCGAFRRPCPDSVAPGRTPLRRMGRLDRSSR